MNADGTVNCGNVQERVTGSCSSTAAIQSITASRAVNCTSDLLPASRVRVQGTPTRAFGTSQTLLDLGGGVTLIARCLSAPNTAELAVVSPASQVNVFRLSGEDGPSAVGPTTTATIASTQANDMGTFGVSGISGAANGREIHGQYTLFVGGTAGCDFSASAVTN